MIVAAWHIVGHHLHGLKVHMWGKAISMAVHWACWIRAYAGETGSPLGLIVVYFGTQHITLSASNANLTMKCEIHYADFVELEK